VHYHGIGEGLGSSEANFRTALDVAGQRQDELWIAGMADIHKYQTERNAARLRLVKSDTKSLVFQLDCATDTALYDQPLTLELTPPAAWGGSSITITREGGIPVATERDPDAERDLLRFEVPPVSGAYAVRIAE